MGEHQLKQVKVLKSTRFSSWMWGEALEKFQLSARGEQCQVLLSSRRCPRWDILRCSLLRGNTWLGSWAGFPTHTHTYLSYHAHITFQNKQQIRDYRRVCLKQLCSSWPISSPTLAENSTLPLGKKLSKLCLTRQLLAVALVSFLFLSFSHNFFLLRILWRILLLSFMKRLLLAGGEAKMEWLQSGRIRWVCSGTGSALSVHTPRGSGVKSE